MADTSWIEAVMAANACIVVAEADLARAISDALSMVVRDEDSTDAERRVSSCADSLYLLRAVQAQRLGDGPHHH